jgi:phosphohistidine phosphatase
MGRFILLLRHGIAEERSDSILDAERELTKKGAARILEIGKGLADIYSDLEAIVTSPLARSVQTGLLLAKGYGHKAPIRQSEALAPGQGTAAFQDLLDALPLRRVIFIGHEPDLTRILGDLCGLDTASLALKKGGCYGVRIKAAGHAKLEWLLSPMALRRTGD